MCGDIWKSLGKLTFVLHSNQSHLQRAITRGIGSRNNRFHEYLRNGCTKDSVLNTPSLAQLWLADYCSQSYLGRVHRMIIPTYRRWKKLAAFLDAQFLFFTLESNTNLLSSFWTFSYSILCWQYSWLKDGCQVTRAASTDFFQQFYFGKRKSFRGQTNFTLY